MMGRVRDEYGRLIPKPTSQVGDNYLEDHSDDVIPIQEQLQSLTVKIQLKELYNHVLKDELEESKVGVSSILKDLQAETRLLRSELVEAFNGERTGVQKALRTHRQFQLAMRDRTGGVAIPWLDDKVSAIYGRVNLNIWRLDEKRRKLEGAERIIDEIEQWPLPGTLPWEIRAIATFHSYQGQIESTKVKLETGNILNSKYREIQSILKEERGKFLPIMALVQDQSQLFSAQLADLQKTLKDAITFRDSAVGRLVLTQKEASENRRRRRLQMVKMKTAVRRLFASSSNSNSRRGVVRNGGKSGGGRVGFGFPSLVSLDSSRSLGRGVFVRMLEYKRGEIEKLQERGSVLLRTMRVDDLSSIPIRFQCVLSLGQQLRNQLFTNQHLLSNLIHQKGQLHLILAHFTYTRRNLTQDFEVRREEYVRALEGTNAERRRYDDECEHFGERIIRIRMGTLRILEQFHEGSGKKAQRCQSDIHLTLDLIGGKMKKLVELNRDLKRIVGKEEPARNYGVYVQHPKLSGRLFRVSGSAEPESTESDEEDGLIDSKVWTRLDMKAKSLRFIHLARLRKGIRGA